MAVTLARTKPSKGPGSRRKDRVLEGHGALGGERLDEPGVGVAERVDARGDVAGPLERAAAVLGVDQLDGADDGPSGARIGTVSIDRVS
jgi:hypothetical protein